MALTHSIRQPTAFNIKINRPINMKRATLLAIHTKTEIAQKKIRSQFR